MKRIFLSTCALMLVWAASGCNAAQSSTPALPLPTAPAPTLASTQTPAPLPTITAAPITATVGSQSGSSKESADAAFAELLEKVKASDPSVDFTEFRLAYAKTSKYDPYSFSTGDLRDSMVTALNDKNYELALKLADQMLAQNFILPEAHIVAIRACEALGQTEEADFHRYVLNGLIASILHSGDGKSPEHAFVVVLIEEEYLILDVLGIKGTGQSEMEANGHSYDVLDGVIAKTGGPTTVYFNIDIPFHGLMNSLNP